MKVELRNSLENYNESKYQDHLFEQYKLFVESAENVTDRRNRVNSFYLTLITSLVGIIGYIETSNIENSTLIVIGLSVSAIIACVYWERLLSSHRQLNKGKFDVIHEMEKELPFNLFEYEWEKLGRGKKPEIYRQTTNLEKTVPVIFGIMFSIAILYEVYNIFCS